MSCQSLSVYESVFPSPKLQSQLTIFPFKDFELSTIAILVSLIVKLSSGRTLKEVSGEIRCVTIALPEIEPLSLSSEKEVRV